LLTVEELDDDDSDVAVDWLLDVRLVLLTVLLRLEFDAVLLPVEVLPVTELDDALLDELEVLCVTPMPIDVFSPEFE
jgi:hypothetical protein